jgi:hypothetical protein
MPDWSLLDDTRFDAADMIADGGLAVTLIRGKSTTLPAQTVIIAPLQSQASEISGGAGTSARVRLALVGPVSFDVQKGDRFQIGVTQYRVTYVNEAIPNRREAECEATQ